MLAIPECAEAQAGLSAADALMIARRRFPNLFCGGILTRHTAHTGIPVDLAEINIALAFLGQCRRSRTPRVHSFDLRRAIARWSEDGTGDGARDVQLGATIAAATALGFPVHSWRGVTTFAPHAIIGVNANDVKRVVKLSAWTAV